MWIISGKGLVYTNNNKSVQLHLVSTTGMSGQSVVNMLNMKPFLNTCKPPMSSCKLVLQLLHFKCMLNIFTTVILPRCRTCLKVAVKLFFQTCDSEVQPNYYTVLFSIV